MKLIRKFFKRTRSRTAMAVDLNHVPRRKPYISPTGATVYCKPAL